jgi:hypothetical protein
MQKYRYAPIMMTGVKPLSRYIQEQSEIQGTGNNSTGDTPAHGSYGSLLFDPRWKSKRAEIMSRDSECCVICKGKDELQVHHRQYQFVKSENAFKMPWDYPDYLLITLCKSCHQRGHSKFKVPTLFI